MAEYRNQWHPGYCSALELGLRKDKEYLTFNREFLINSKPIQMDLLIIRKKRNIIISNSIGKIFRTHNIVEFKSPKAELNYDTFIKTHGYACLYKAGEKHIGEIDIHDITLTFVRSAYPRKLMEVLKNDGFAINNPYSGIYYIERDGCIPSQVVISSDVPDDDNVWLRSLTDKLNIDDVKEVANAARLITDKGDIDNAEAVLQVSMRANQSVYDKVREVDYMSCEALREFFKPELDEATRSGIQIGRSDGERSKLTSQISRKIKKGKPLSVIADELEESEEVIEPIYNELIAEYVGK